MTTKNYSVEAMKLYVATIKQSHRVLDIIDSLLAGEKVGVVAKRMGISPQAVSDVKYRFLPRAAKIKADTSAE